MSPSLSAPSSRDSLSRWAFFLGSLVAVAAGAWTMRTTGEPAALWLRNGAAWVAALALGSAIRRGAPVGDTVRRGLLVGAILALGATLLSSGLEGVHRWIRVGPIQLHIAALVVPVLIVLLAREPVAAWRTAVAVSTGVLLALQPDASQAAAFALACGALAWRAPTSEPRTAPLLFVLAPLAGAVVAALRPDPLLPVAHVEEIVSLAASQSLPLAIGIVAGLLGAVLAPLGLVPSDRRGALPLAVYLAAITAAPLFGAFPVPFAGYGVSFVVGPMIGFALLAQRGAQ